MGKSAAKASAERPRVHIYIMEVDAMETKNIILELRTKKRVVSGRVSTKGYGYTAGGVTLGKTVRRFQMRRR